MKNIKHFLRSFVINECMPIEDLTDTIFEKNYSVEDKIRASIGQEMLIMVHFPIKNGIQLKMGY